MLVNERRITHTVFLLKIGKRQGYQKNHKLYKLLLDSIPENMLQQSFEIDGNTYRWMAIQEMEKDERIMEVNDEVVAFVKTKC